MRFITITLFLLEGLFFLAGNSYSQSVELHTPLDIPLFLSGNFGELRSTHFHAGIDLKTNGEIGQPVRALLDGYVSRVKVRSGGYGNAIYITHRNGYTSVYGHLHSYYDAIAKYIKKEQYRIKSFEIDSYLEKDQFIVKKGMLIGISGNTGRSGGPHLHLEYRDQNQVPMNLLLYNLPIVDSIPPQIRRLVVYDNIHSETFQCQNKINFPVSGKQGKYRLVKPIKGFSQVAFGIEAYDYLNGSSNRCGVYTIELYVNGKQIFANKIEKIGFSEARYIRSYSDYEEKKLNRRSVHRLFKEPNNNLSVYENIVNAGIVSLEDSINYEGLIVAKDAHGNESTLNFDFSLRNGGVQKISDTGEVKFKYRQENIYENEHVKFVVPKKSLYADKWFFYAESEVKEGELSHTFKLGNALVPMHKYPTLSIKSIRNLNGVSPEKLLIVNVDDKGNFSSEGGRWSNGWLSARVSGFGRYSVKADTIPPVIKPVSFRSGWYGAGDIISFKIYDDLSGIKTYNGYINDSWVLFEYDAKTSKISYRIDSKRLKRLKSAHTLKIYVMDERNNIQSFSDEFYY